MRGGRRELELDAEEGGAPVIVIAAVRSPTTKRYWAFQLSPGGEKSPQPSLLMIYIVALHELSADLCFPN